MERLIDACKSPDGFYAIITFDKSNMLFHVIITLYGNAIANKYYKRRANAIKAAFKYSTVWEETI